MPKYEVRVSSTVDYETVEIEAENEEEAKDEAIRMARGGELATCKWSMDGSHGQYNADDIEEIG